MKLDTTARSLREELEEVDYTPPKLVAESLIKDVSSATVDRIEKGPQADTSLYRQLYGSDKMYFMVPEVKWSDAGTDYPELTGLCLAPAKALTGMEGGIRLVAMPDEDEGERLDIAESDAGNILSILERCEHLILISSNSNPLVRGRAKPSAQVRVAVQILESRLKGTVTNNPATPDQQKAIVERLNALAKKGRFHTLSEVLFSDFGVSGDLETVYTNVTGNALKDAHDAQAMLDATREVSGRLLAMESEVQAELEIRRGRGRRWRRCWKGSGVWKRLHRRKIHEGSASVCSPVAICV